MTDLATQPLLKQLDDAHLSVFAVRLTNWLITDLNASRGDSGIAPDFTESRAKALLRAAGAQDRVVALISGGGSALLPAPVSRRDGHQIGNAPPAGTR